MRIERLDHLVLTVGDIARTVEFYTDILGMEEIVFEDGRRALAFGYQKINLHPRGAEYLPHAKMPLPGSADLCFIAETPIYGVIAELKRKNVIIEEGPVEKSGALGPIRSVYFRDPDGNLVEVSNYL